MSRLDNILAPMLGMTFVAVVAVALGSAWVAPAHMAPTTLEATASVPEQVVITPARIDVVGVREAGTARKVSYETSETVTGSAI
jgi:hypothetical protein